MSWYRDPQLFMCVHGFQGNYPKHFYIKRFTQTFGVSTLGVRDLDNPKLLDFSEDLNLGYNKLSDYDSLKHYIIKEDAAANTQKWINCQGMTLTLYKKTYKVIWGHEKPGSPFYSTVPVPLGERELVALLSACIDDRDREMADKQVLQDRVTSLDTMNSDLQDQVQSRNEAKEAVINERDKEKALKQVLQERITNLEATISDLKDQLRNGIDAKETATDEQDKEKAENQETVTNLETENVNCKSNLRRRNAKRNRVSSLRAKIATLEDEARRESYVNTALISDLKKIIILSEDNLLREKFASNRLKKDKDRKLLEKQAIQEKNSGLQDQISELMVHLKDWKYEVSDAQDQLDREKKDNHALRQEVAGMKSLHELCGCEVSHSAEKEIWMSGYPVPNNWVPFEDLRVQGFSRNGKPLTITKTISSEPAFTAANTTNVQVKYFYRAMLNKCVFPIVVVNVEELIPNKEKARFDPAIWSLFNNGGIGYAALKPFESEMNARKK